MDTSAPSSVLMKVVIFPDHNISFNSVFTMGSLSKPLVDMPHRSTLSLNVPTKLLKTLSASTSSPVGTTMTYGVSFTSTPSGLFPDLSTCALSQPPLLIGISKITSLTPYLLKTFSSGDANLHHQLKSRKTLFGPTH